ncbi:ABC transporter ATP-binding protein [Kitasatospora atroaurantiaca]|uniref:ABC-2 type transport system ATP-binding protein n=1 Tax=Kitasatospora atroaurantiaca TaxID=285545 RepID=A0A561EIU8_9ACTN|nr:ABC transporter ATP-binding protein [Kitasatospora atroaurantiaca]TWE15540.1 ABC-2 type transport system ATP-binding protein [Kitasatospora atroaurantiaca]
MNAIEVEGLCRTYGTGRQPVTALDQVDLTVPEGQIIGLLGANGAGKTTLIKILSTLLLPTGGRARVAGHDVVGRARQVRREVSVVYGGDRGFYGRLTGRQNLRFFGMLQGLSRGRLAERTEAVLAEVGLLAAADQRVETYSRGMRQRLHIAVGLVASPRVLLLDEPSIGLDPVEAHRLRDAIGAMRGSGVTVLITTHQLLDIESLADRVVMLHQGRIIHDLSLEEFRKRSGYTATVRVTGRGEPPEQDGQDTGGPVVTGVTLREGLWTADVRIPAWSPSTFQWLGERLSPDSVVDLEVQALRLEDVYRQLAGELS